MSDYEMLNEKQKEAVLHTEGPLLILAGAGSGKTRVLTYRIAYLIEEKEVNPWNIFAITFTNKAAQEMRSRVDELVQTGASGVWVSTFHSACVRILRRYANLIGYENNFTIYDRDDQKTLMKEVLKQLNIDTKLYKERSLLSAISRAKDEMLTPKEFAQEAGGDYEKEQIAKIYKAYEKQKKANNALDFDDLLLKTVELFETQPEVLEQYQERFRYIMVDEYQDTNRVQFRLIYLLAKKYENLCVVGDDDQSIYKFRGANIYNILDFEKSFPEARVIKLEQNYRSTGNILDAANGVIRNNYGRKEKTLWTENPRGKKIEVRQFDNGYDEADNVVGEIAKQTKEGASYSDYAILYRTNAQSRVFEEKLVTANIPYKLVGGVNFYARREIKDMLAYLKTIDGGQDDLAVRRIINVPKRGIGLQTVQKIQEMAFAKGVGFYEALKQEAVLSQLGRGKEKVKSFVTSIQSLQEKQEKFTLSELLEEILTVTEYEEMLKEEGEEEAGARLENLEELKSKMVIYEENCEEETPSLSGFLEEVALVADIDALEENSNHVVLMTLHSAKGLEFPHVYLTGLEEGVFPGYMAKMAESPEEIEEERRLCYVGITRAMEELTLSCATKRMIRGEMQYNKRSRFLEEIPESLLTGEKQKFLKEKQVKELHFQTPASRGAGRQKFKSKAYHTTVKRLVGLDEGKLPYDVGDRILHGKFGEGIVEAIAEGGRDYEVTVNFDSVGVKKMFAGFAKLQKL